MALHQLQSHRPHAGAIVPALGSGTVPFPGLLTLTALLLAGSLAPAKADVGLFRNIRNVPFAAVCNGPQGAIVVPEPERPSPLDGARVIREQRLHDAIATQHPIRAFSQALEALRFLRARGISSPRLRPCFPRTIVHTRGNRLILPDLWRARDSGRAIGDPGNTITFEFEGWSASDKAALAAYLAAALPVARMVYGPPAFSITVTIIQDPALHELQGGTYDVTTNELRLPPLSGNFPEDSFVLIMLVLRAFRDDVALFYDSWEQGMTGAAATAVQTSPGVSPAYDPANPGPFYSGSVYEPQNQTPLGNSTWFPASGFSGMLVWRIAQARAAWLKCYVEDPQFFARFNAQYYARLNALPPDQQALLPGDTLSLVEIAQTVLPRVEGAIFWAWYRQQYTLDTSVTVGPKLFTWNIPLPDAVALIVEHYDTSPTGDETPRGGTAYTVYFNYDFTRTLYAQEGNEIEVPGTGDAAGEGFLLPSFFNIGGPQRITVQVELNGLWARYPYPYGVREFDPGQNNLYGAMIGPIEGAVSVTGPGVKLTDVSVQRGIWAAVATQTPLSPMQLTITYADDQGNSVTRLVNVAFDSYDVLMPAGSRSPVTRYFPVGTNGLYLMSVPVLPVRDDPAEALGIPADQLLLARWGPNAPEGGRYDIYPAIAPFRPGQGYWLRVLSDVTVAVDGIVPSAVDDVTTQLYAGWNMVGCGRPTGIDLGDVLVQRGAANSEPWADAVTDGWVQGGIWGYDQTDGYRLVGRLEPWGGYWVRCLLAEGATLIFPGPSGGSSVRDQARAEPLTSPFGKTIWTVPLVLEAGPLRSLAVMGAAASARDGYDRAHDLQAPPPFGDQPALRFVHSDWAANSGEYATDIRASNARGPWRLRVTGVPPGGRAVLRWPDLSSLPAEIRPVLIDLQTRREVYMRTSTGHRFVSSGRARRFEVELRGADAGSLAVTALTSMQTRQGVAVTFSLTTAAAVTVRVMNIAGRLVRELVAAKPQPAGESTLPWDLRNATGGGVPNGTYLIQVTAESADGQRITAVSPVSVTR